MCSNQTLILVLLLVAAASTFGAVAQPIEGGPDSPAKRYLKNSINCGAASTFVLLRLAGKHPDFLESEKDFPKGDENTNANRIVEILRRYGMDTQVYMVSRGVPRHIDTASIVHVSFRHEGRVLDHFLVVEPVDRRSLRVYDAPQRPQLVERDRLAKNPYVTGYVIPAFPNRLAVSRKRAFVETGASAFLILSSSILALAVVTWGGYRSSGYGVPSDLGEVLYAWRMTFPVFLCDGM